MKLGQTGPETRCRLSGEFKGKRQQRVFRPCPGVPIMRSDQIVVGTITTDCGTLCGGTLKRQDQ